jgi:hypothetical protein
VSGAGGCWITPGGVGDCAAGVVATAITELAVALALAAAGGVGVGGGGGMTRVTGTGGGGSALISTGVTKGVIGLKIS